MEIDSVPDKTPASYKKYIRENYPEKDEQYLHYLLIRIDWIIEFLVSPENIKCNFEEILNTVGITPGEYNLIGKYYEAIENVRDEVDAYNRFVKDSGLDQPLLEVVINKILTESNYRGIYALYRNTGDTDYRDLTGYCRLKSYEVVEQKTHRAKRNNSLRQESKE